MKLSSILMLVSMLHVMAVDLYSQTTRLTLNLHQVTLPEVFDGIERQSEFLFVYSDADIDKNMKFDVEVNNQRVEEILNNVLKNTNVMYVIKDRHILLITKGDVAAINAQQSIPISGTVSDANGETLPGVNVLIKGTTQGTVTDINGAYSLTVPDENATLVFSSLGYGSQEIVVGSQRAINVTLSESAREIEEVVVVGYGVQKKVNLTGAVGTVSAAELQNRPVQNIQQSLQGLVPGLNIWQNTGFLDATPDLNVRGIGNLGTGSSASPLVLVDGVESDMTYVNPQDVESISVLKDAAASSIYGSRAPFGVILITTKKGDAGNIKVNYNNNFRWGAPTVRPHPMDSYTLATFINDECKNDNVSPFFTDENLQRIKDYQDGIITTVNVVDPANQTQWTSGYPGSNANIDYYDLVYNNRAFTQEHNVSASGGNNRFTFYMGFGYLDQSGLLKIADDSFKMYTPTGTIEAQMTDWLKLRYTVRFVHRTYSRPTYWTQGFFNDLGRQGWAVLPWRDDNGVINNNSMIKNIPFGGRTNEEKDVFNNHGSLILEPLKNWITTVEINYNTVTWNQHAVMLPTYKYDVFGNPIVHYSQNYVANTFSKDNFMTVNVYSSYRFSLNNRHHFSAMAGMQTEDMKTTAFGLSRVGVIIPELPVMDLTDGLDYSTGDPLVPSVNGSMKEWNTAGFFGRLNYDYQGRYLLEANLRYDGTSRFRAERRWNWSPSVSAGWNIAHESFWDSLIKTVNMLKLRGSYGRLGNQNTDGWYPTYQVMSVDANSGAWLQNGAKPNVAYSPELISAYLTWEKINMVNVGVDAGAFNNRLTASFDYFVRKTFDMVGPAIELPVILGKTVPRTNNTDLKTYGFELVLAWQDKLKNGLSYSTRFLLSDSRTTITRYPNFTKSLDTYYEGQLYGNIWGYETIGIARSPEEMQAHLATLPNGAQNSLGYNWAAGDIMYRDLNGDGKISSGANTFDDPGDRKIIGNSEPRYVFGLDMNATWKGFDLRIFFQGVAKREHFTNTPLFFGISVGGFWHQNPLKEHADYFREEPSNHLPANLNAYYPRPLYNNYTKNQHAQTRWLQNAAFIRLKNISLGYTIPADITKKIFVNQLRVFVAAENIWTGTKLATMFDPESMRGMHDLRGDGYPLQKLTSLGLNVTF